MMKIVSGAAVIITSVLAVVLLIQKEFNWAVFCITIMFTLTNSFRARDMAKKGYDKEARFMRNMSIFFAVASAGILVANLFT
ncbi:hypothetical protein [Kurthia sibirica]|uniref:Aspartyl/asparaginyl-tRNA synthetase n=1 Tax=Kurthia sibirica TaxID=202750 RepID=A0A2U3AK48_9BACL|nr:hypothetical protein [Kurthia sibirica]PWI24907.1 hypothetical protein DEX24_10870 [Kurthia sibirica]GEK33183.1 hypothetical protein KSI01_07160 [Kurthia sibirica]